MKETIKNMIWFFCFMFTVTVITLGLLSLGAWLDSAATCEPVVIKKEKYVTCEPVGKGWSKCPTEWI